MAGTDIAVLGIAVDSTSAVTATGVLDGLAAAATNAASANERLAGSASSAAGAQSQVAGAAASASAVVTTAADRLIASLEKQIVLFNASDVVIARYNANTAKMTEAQTAEYVAHTEVLSQLQAENAQRLQFYAIQEAGVAAGEKFIASLVTQEATIGLTKTQLLEYKAAQLGVAEAAAPLIASIEAQTAALADQAKATTVLGESEDAAAARISAMIAVSLQNAAVANDNTIAAERYAASVDEMAAAATKAEKAQASLVGATEAVVVAQREAATQISAADTTISASAEKVVNALERQILALTAGKEALALYDAQAAGLSVTETELVVAKTRELEATKAQVAAGAEMAAAYEAEAVSAKVLQGSTSGLTSEILVLFRELGRGDLSRFGGSLTRLISLAGATSLLFNPLTLSLIALTAAVVKVENEDDKLNRALILTNDYAGVTASGLKIMAESVVQSGATIGVANEALAELAATGRVTSNDIEKLGTATAGAATYTGVSVKQMVGEFTKLQEEPLKASVKLNEQYHYLTVATYDQIAALEKQGDAIGAAQVAQDAFADASVKAAEKIKEQQGPLLKFWQSLKVEISGAIEAIGSLGATAGPAEILARDQANRAARAPIRQWTPEDQERITRETAAVNAANSEARKKAADAENTQAIITAKERYETFNRHFWTPQERRAKEYQEYLDKIATPLGLSAEQQLSDEEKIAAKYKDKAGKPISTSAVDNAQFQQDQAALRNQYDQQTKLNSDQLKILENDHKARLKSDEEFYAQEFVLNDKDLQYKLSYYARSKELLEADMKDSSTGAATKIKDQTAIDKLNSDALVALSDYAAKDREIADQQKANTNKKEDAVRSYTDALNKQFEAAQKGAAAQLAGFGQGTREAALSAKDVAVQQAAADEILKLQAAAQANPQTDQTVYTRQIALVQAQADRLVALNHDTYSRITENQQDWLSGAKTAWANWADSAANVNSQFGNTFTTALNGMTDALTTFVTTGKLSFTSLADSIIKDLIRIAVEQAELKLVGLVAGAFGSAASAGSAAGTAVTATSTAGSFGQDLTSLSSSTMSTSLPATLGGVRYATGGFVSGSGTGTSDSIDAKLSNGEFVVNAAATAQNRPLLEAMNGGKGSSGQRHFATGGYVGNAGNASATGGTTIVFNMPSTSSANASGQSSSSSDQKTKTAAFQKELETTVLSVIRKHSEPGGQVNKIIKQVSR